MDSTIYTAMWQSSIIVALNMGNRDLEGGTETEATDAGRHVEGLRARSKCI